MAKIVDLSVSFYNHMIPNAASSVAFGYCPLCGTDFEGSTGEPWSSVCEHVLFTYDYLSGEFWNVNESVSDLVKRAPDRGDHEVEGDLEWVTGQIVSDSAVCFRIVAQPGQDAEGVAIAFDLDAVIIRNPSL